MKTRIGFVSNSSTTSFCIYGVRIHQRDIIPLFQESYKNNPDYWKIIDDYIKKSNLAYEGNLLLELKRVINGEDGSHKYDDDEFEYIQLFLENVAELDIYNDYDNSIIYIGARVTNKEKDETLSEFGKNIEDKILKVFGKNIPCEFF